MNLLSRAFALLAVSLAGALAVTGCSAAPDAASEEAPDAVGEAAFSKAQCKEIHHQFVANLNATNEEYKQCAADAQRKLMAELTDIVVGNIVGAQPCVGSFLATILTGKCILSDDPAKCIFDVGESALENLKSSVHFAKCAANLGAEGVESAEATEAYFKGVKESVYIGLALAAAHTTAYVMTYKGCADQLASDVEGVEPIACNPSKSICFDAPGCPTLARTHSAKTHMTGLVDRFTITRGAATDTTGQRIACASYLVQGSGGGSSCHAN